MIEVIVLTYSVLLFLSGRGVDMYKVNIGKHNVYITSDNHTMNRMIYQAEDESYFIRIHGLRLTVKRDPDGHWKTI